jgi:hypothetical protein
MQHLLSWSNLYVHLFVHVKLLKDCSLASMIFDIKFFFFTENCLPILHFHLDKTILITLHEDIHTFLHISTNTKLKLNSVALVSDRRLLVKLVPTFADRGCCVVSATDSHGR